MHRVRSRVAPVKSKSARSGCSASDRPRIVLRTSQEIGDVSERESALVRQDAIAIEAPVLAAEFKVVLAMQVVDCVRQDGRVVTAALWKALLATKLQSDSAHRDVRQAGRAGKAIHDSEGARILPCSLGVGHKSDANAVVSQAEIVHQAGNETAFDATVGSEPPPVTEGSSANSLLTVGSVTCAC